MLGYPCCCALWRSCPLNRRSSRCRARGGEINTSNCLMCTFDSYCWRPCKVLTGACLGTICAIYDIVLSIHVCLCRRLVIRRHFTPKRTTFHKPTIVLMLIPSVMQQSVHKFAVLLPRLVVVISLNFVCPSQHATLFILLFPWNVYGA